MVCSLVLHGDNWIDGEPGGIGKQLLLPIALWMGRGLPCGEGGEPSLTVLFLRL